MSSHPPDSNGKRLISRRRFLALTGFAGAASLTNGFLIEPRTLTITRKDIPCATLPPALDGLRIACMADFHFRPGCNDSLLEKAVSEVNKENVDLIALPGDFINHDAAVLTPLLSHLGKMRAAHGIFASMGNHDAHYLSTDGIHKRFNQAGISFLLNQNTHLSIHGETLAIAATDSVTVGTPDRNETLKGISPATPVIALVHEPDYFDVMKKKREITLQLSGHTHGGQCRVPIIGYAPLKVRGGKKYIYGHFQDGPSNLFVTRGVGTTGIPIRFACPPELAILTLRRSGPRE